MPRNLVRYQQSGQSHFVTFSCYRRQPRFDCGSAYDRFVVCLEETRRRFRFYVYGYVVMPEHVHLLLSEPMKGSLADAVHDLKMNFARSLPRRHPGPFWQKRYYDRNVRDAEEFMRKLRYLHRNPVKRGLVKEPGEWKWSSFRHYAFREKGVVEIESEWTARDRETLLRGGPTRTFLAPS